MLFFFGTGTTTISSHPLTGVPCINCGYTSVGVAIYSRYLHLFWLPLIPLGKHSVSQCANCKQVLKDAQMPPAYRTPALAWQQAARLPISNYLAISIVGLAFVAIMIIGALNGHR